MKKHLLKISGYLCCLSFLTIIYGCPGNSGGGKIKIDGIQSKVQRVVDGNTVELKNGLTVEILGIKPSEHTQNYLEKFAKGETVIVIADSKQNKQKSHIKSYKTKVRAYIKLKGDRYCLSGKMLLNHTAKLSQTGYTDSLEHFKIYAEGPEHIRQMSSSELREYMRPATFLIVTEDGSSGTGFFINDNGLALTNNHVLNGSQNARIFFFKDNGEADEVNYRGIKRYLLTAKDEKIDFTVFLVQLDNGEKVRYMPLIKQHEKEGEPIAKLGCPVGLTCDFKTGVLSNYYDGYLSHSCPSNNGDSGGPIVNMKGEVVGINQSIEFNTSLSQLTGSVQKAEGVAYAVDAVLIKEVLEKHEIEYGR